MVKQEQELRVELAACFRIFDYLGWTELVYNHITVKVPGERAHFLINPFGFHYGTICASDLVKMDIDGNLVGDSPNSINLQGLFCIQRFTRRGAILIVSSILIPIPLWR